ELVLAIEGCHPGHLETVVPVWARELCRLFDRLGFRIATEVLEMAVELRPPLPRPGWPAGVRMRPFNAERDAADVHACLVEAIGGAEAEEARRPRPSGDRRRLRRSASTRPPRPPRPCPSSRS